MNTFGSQFRSSRKGQIYRFNSQNANKIDLPINNKIAIYTQLVKRFFGAKW